MVTMPAYNSFETQLNNYAVCPIVLKDLKCLLNSVRPRGSSQLSGPNPQETQTEQLPLSSIYKVVDYVNIFRSEKWWEAIVVIESFGRRSIAMYLWQKKGNQWKRKHKFQIRNLQEWEKLKAAIEKLAPAMAGSVPSESR